MATIQNINKSGIIIWAVTIGMVFLVTSCFKPATKDSYLNRYERFVDNVKKNRQDYTKSDWNYADKQFKKFNQEWYNEFKDELSLSEQAKIMSLAARYISYKGSKEIDDFSNEIFRKDTKEMKDKIEYYLDHNMDKDLQKLKEGAKEIGDSTLRVVEDIIREIKGH